MALQSLKKILNSGQWLSGAYTSYTLQLYQYGLCGIMTYLLTYLSASWQGSGKGREGKGGREGRDGNKGREGRGRGVHMTVSYARQAGRNFSSASTSTVVFLIQIR